MGKFKRKHITSDSRIKKLPIAERRLKALRLRQGGMSYDRIGKECGVTVGTSYQDVMFALDEIDKERKEEANNLRVLEITRLDRLLEKLEKGYKLKTVTKTYVKGDKQTVVESETREICLTEFVMGYIRIMDRRARYIVGLDVPKEVKTDVGDNLREAMEVASTDLLTTLKTLAGSKKRG